nr:immunoglobulin light chain junction region [Macaca mulatta]
YMQALQFPWTF